MIKKNQFSKKKIKVLKSELRKKYLKKREQNYNESICINFNRVRNIIIEIKKKNLVIGGYFPVSYEIDCLEILRKLQKEKFTISLPVIKKKNEMEFCKYSFNEPLKLNIFGIPEPSNKTTVFPDVLFVPLVAFDKYGFRIGYGGGFYDRYLKKIKRKKKILSIGFAYSFQKTNKVPNEHFDKSLDLVITEKQLYK